MKSRLEEVGGVVVALTASGLSLEDACREAGIALNTVKTWLKRGRREVSGPYGAFARSIEAARTLAKTPTGPMSEEELNQAVWRAVRKGSVPAMRLAWELLKAAERPSKADPLSVIDQLAARRTREGA